MQETSISHKPSWLKRVGWLAAFWMAGVVGLGIVATVFHALMAAAGLTQ